MGSKLNLPLRPRISSLILVGLWFIWPAWVWPQSIAATVSLGNAPQAVALNTVTNRIYVTGRGGLAVIDGNTSSSAMLQLASSAVAVDETTDTVYAIRPCGKANIFAPFFNGNITLINGATNSTTTIADPHASCPRSLAVNPVTNKVYVANNGSNNVTVIDGATNSMTTITDPNAKAPSAIAVNTLTNEIYVANLVSNNVTVIDGATNSTATVTDPDAVSPVAVAVNAITNRIYIANAGNYPTGPNRGNVTVIDGATKGTTTITDPNALSPGSGPTIAVNGTTNKVYVLNSRSNNVTVIDGGTNSTTTVTDLNAVSPVAVSVNESTDTIYVANRGGTFGGANPGSVTVINGVNNATTTLINPNASQPVAVVANPKTDKTYVADGAGCGGGGCATVLDGGGTPTTHTIWVLLTGNGSGTVTNNPPGSTCTGSCPASYAPGTAVSLSASAGPSSRFTAWQGPCSGTTSCNLVASADQFVTAVFTFYVAVPNVVGQTVPAAETALGGDGLLTGALTQQSGTTVPAGHVISQSVPAGTLVTVDTPVNLVVAPTAVPNVVGLTQAAATSAITGAGLALGTVTQQSSNKAAPGSVISESPVAGTQLVAGSAVDLVTAEPAVPNVVGLTQTAATTAITGSGLVVGTVTQQSSSSVALGQVVSEDPVAGTDMGTGSAVNLVISSGDSTGSGSSGSGGGGGGGIDPLTISALLGSLLIGLRRVGVRSNPRCTARTDRPIRRSPKLGLKKRTRTNHRELRRKGCCYPLRFEQKSEFKQAAVSG